MAMIMLSQLAVNAQQSYFSWKDKQMAGLPPGAEVKSIKLPGRVSLEYIEQGNPKGTPVIFLHGISDSRHSYDLLFPYLPPSIHAYSISHRGHGNSEKPQTGYRNKDFSDDIATFIKELNIRKPIIVGHSMSTLITMQFALDYPELASGIVLIGSFVNYSGNQDLGELSKAISTFEDPVDTAFIVDFQVSTLHNPVPQDFFRLAVDESTKLPARAWRGIADDWNNLDLKQRLSKVSIPTLNIWGDKDSFCPREDQDFIRNSIKSSKLLVYDNIGHAVHWEHPRKVADDLIEFINSIK